MTRQSRRRIAVTVAAVVTATLTACSSDDGPRDAVESAASARPHGYVEGAEETADTQYRLVVGDAGDSGLAVIDIATGDIDEVGSAPGMTELLGDGRYGYAHTVGGTTHIVDSGGWTVDHGDHVHYYRADPRSVGTVSASGELIAVHASRTRTALTYTDSTVVLDRTAQDTGEVRVLERRPRQSASAVVPLDGTLVTPTATHISVRSGDDERLVPCANPGAQSVTRRGAVFGCADGAVLIADSGVATRIAYPSGISGSATTFAHRPGSAGVFATGPSGPQLLDVSARTWTPLAADVPDRSTATGETGPVVSVGRGIVGVRRTAQDPPVTTAVPGASEASDIAADTARAYVNDPRSNRIFEIDYRDDARLARTITTPGAATHFVETGR